MRNMILAFAIVTITTGTAKANCTSEVNDAFAKLRKFISTMACSDSDPTISPSPKTSVRSMPSPAC